MKKLFVTLILSVGLTPAWAEWVYLGQSDDYFIHVKSNVMKSGTTVKGWVMFDRRPGSTARFASYVGLNEARCNSGQLRVLQIVFYNGQFGSGVVEQSINSAGEWSYPPPDSVLEIVLKTLCNSR